MRCCKTKIILTAIALLSLTFSITAQDPAPEKLRSAKVQARLLHADVPYFGLPERVKDPNLRYNALASWDCSERIGVIDGVWKSDNIDLRMPNWVAWDPKDRSDYFFMRYMPASRIFGCQLAWRAALNACLDWVNEKPAGKCTIVCGPLVTPSEFKKEGGAVPYAFFIVACKRTRSALGYKSIGFIVHNKMVDIASTDEISCSVNSVELKSGYDFFPLLPEGVRESVEEMTVYELYCPYQEQAEYTENPTDDREQDMQEAFQEYLEDLRDR